MSKYQPKEVVKVYPRGGWQTGIIVDYDAGKRPGAPYTIDLGTGYNIWVSEDMIESFDRPAACTYCTEVGQISMFSEEVEDEEVELHIDSMGRLKVFDSLRGMTTGIFPIRYCPHCGRKL